MPKVRIMIIPNLTLFCVSMLSLYQVLMFVLPVTIIALTTKCVQVGMDVIPALRASSKTDQFAKTLMNVPMAIMLTAAAAVLP